jgi:TusA-related sulfurtransferase
MLHGSWKLAQPEDSELLDLTGEVEPFISVSVKERLSNLEPNRILVVKFNYEPTLHNLPRLLTPTPHRILLIRWNEEGAWEALIRVGEKNETT